MLTKIHRLSLSNNHHTYLCLNCLVLQPGERRQTTTRWDTTGSAEAAQRLSFHEVELAIDTEDMLLVIDVDLDRMCRSRYRHYRYNA